MGWKFLVLLSLFFSTPGWSQEITAVLIATSTSGCSEGNDPHWQCRGRWVPIEDVKDTDYVASCASSGVLYRDCSSADYYKQAADLQNMEAVLVCYEEVNYYEDNYKQCLSDQRYYISAVEVFADRDPASDPAPTPTPPPLFCTPGSTQTMDCTNEISNALQAQRVNVCNENGSSFVPGRCEAVSCNSGYILEDNACVLENTNDNGSQNGAFNSDVKTIFAATTSCREGNDPHWQCGATWQDPQSIDDEQYVAACPLTGDNSATDCASVDTFKKFKDVQSNEGVRVCFLDSSLGGRRLACLGSNHLYMEKSKLLSGGDTVDPTPTPVPTPMPDPTPTPVPTPVPEPTPTPVPTPMPGPTPDPVPSNPGQIFFNDQTSARLEGNCKASNSFGSHFADLDGDGHLDKLSLSHAGYDHCIWRNDGTGRFVHQSSASRDLAGTNSDLTCTWSAQVVDINGDGKPEIWCRGTEAGSNLFINESNGSNIVFRNVRDWLGAGHGDEYFFADFNGDGTLDRINHEDGVILDTLSENRIFSNFSLKDSDWVDFNNDSWPDLYSPSQNRIYRNNAGQSFTSIAYDTALDECSSLRNVFHFDYDKDGDIDLLCVRGADGASDDIVIVRNDGNFNFTAIGTGFTNVANGNTSVYLTKGVVGFDDLDNNGLEDIVVTFPNRTIKLYQQTSPGQFEYKQNSDLLSRAISSLSYSGAQAPTGDFDSDGLVDLMLGQDLSLSNTIAGIWKNTTSTTNRYVSVLLRGDNMGEGNNVNGIGAKIIVRRSGSSQIVNTYYVSPSFRRSRSNFLYHIGVGQANKVDIEVVWPSGFEASQTFDNLDTNKKYRIEYIESQNDLLQNWMPGNGW